jgi:hypothetical protein
MGLLDDAIREHLELKRLRGADPGAVAREEHDALGPVRRRDDAEYDEAAGEPDPAAHGEEALSVSDSAPTADSPEAGAVGQETVEINMEAELAAESDSGPQPETDRGAHTTPVAHPASGRTISEESLEWEVPDKADEPPRYAESNAAQDPDPGNEPDQAEPVEDVLEETPDFLRETPEQERLWFEQRPPRDFDFNE